MTRGDQLTAIIDDSVLQRTGKFLPGAGLFYDHSEGEPVWGQDLVYALYTDHKTSYPLAFRQFEKDECEDQEETEKKKYDPARELITELDSWFAHDSGLITRVESYSKDWLGSLRSNQQVEYANKQRRVDALEERIDTEEREIDDEAYNICTKTLPVSKLMYG